MQSYLFFGLPGSGKGTQKEMLKDMLEKKEKATVVTIETGQLLRDMVKNEDSKAKQHLAKIMKSGGLVPSAFPVTTWVNALLGIQETYNHIIIDGAGRKLIEARAVVELLHFFNTTHIHIIYLKISDKEAINRLLKRGREDDRESTIKERLIQYKNKKTGTMASINFLRKSKETIFHEIDGAGEVEEVHKRVQARLGYDHQE